MTHIARPHSAILLDLVGLFDAAAKNFETAFALGDRFADFRPEVERALAAPCDGRRYIGNCARVLLAALDDIISGPPDPFRAAMFRVIAHQAAQLVRSEAHAAFVAERVSGR